MNTKTLKFHLLCLCFASLFSCVTEQKKTKTTEVEFTEQTTETVVKETQEVIEQDNKITIYQTSFLELSPETNIKEYTGTLEKDLLQNGEGDFDIYNIKDKGGNVVGYFLPYGMNEDSVGTITVTSKLAQTEDGIKIGDTFETLLEKYPTLDVFGSEIEGYTQAIVGKLGYRLDEQHYNHELKPTDIKKEAKIIEITIR